MTTRPDSIARLNLDLATAKVLVWFVRGGRAADLTAESHLFFWDRYTRLAECHRRLRRPVRARALDRKAAEHYRLAGGDGPPFAAGMAMPRPRRWIVVDARGRSRLDRPDKVA